MKDKEKKMAQLAKILEDDLFTIGIIRKNDYTELLNYEDFDRVYRII